MFGLKPFFTFYGGKWRAAVHYPPPQYGSIVEPFAGSAGYSLRYFDRQVVLVEKDPVIAGTWEYLLAVSAEEILRLPDLGGDQTVDDLQVCEEAKLIIGWWLKGGSREPVRKPTGWMKKASTPGYKNGGSKSWWGENIRMRIASQIDKIRHWKIIEGDYSDAPDGEATWFVDPPYDNAAGRHYRCGAGDIDYAALAQWCHTRVGQTIVCEQAGANWLPFTFWRETRSATRGGARSSKEVIWTSPS